MNLPKCVEVVPMEAIGPQVVKRHHWKYFVGTIRDIGVEPIINPDLKTPSWGSFEFRVDGQLAVYEYSDFLPFDRACRRYEHWFQRMFCSGHKVVRNLASFPSCSFLDWQQYRKLIAENRYAASGHMILHKQSAPVPKNPVGIELRRRRLKAREILVDRFGSRVDTKVDSQPEFYQKAFACLVSVHIPGSWEHCLDRGQHQLMGLGVCTVSPEIWPYCLDERPQAWLHYVPIRDDFSDLAEKVEWCDTHREECRRIGERARAFFEAHSTPKVIWQYVMQRLQQNRNDN